MTKEDCKKMFPDGYEDWSINEKLAFYEKTGCWYGGGYRESKLRDLLNIRLK